MTFAEDIVCWFKQDEDDISTSSTVEFYTSTGCNGLFVGAWDFASVGIESIKTFSSDASVTARSIRVTGDGAKRSIPTSHETSNMTLISDGSSRELISITDLSTRALYSRSEVDALKLVLAGDEIWSLVDSGGWAKWIIMKPYTGRDAGAALLPCSSSTTRDWAASMAAKLASNVLTGELNGNFASWSAKEENGNIIYSGMSEGKQISSPRCSIYECRDLYTHLIAAALYTAGTRLIDWGCAAGSSWVSATVDNYLEEAMALFTIWTEQG